MSEEAEVTDKGRLLFGAGFVFGVMFTMLVLAVVVSTVAAGANQLEAGLFTIGAGVLFAAIVGTSLYFLAFPENRVRIPVDGFEPPVAAGDGESNADLDEPLLEDGDSGESEDVIDDAS